MDLQNKILESTRQLVKCKMQENDIAHDYSHIKRVVNLSLHIAQSYLKCDLFLVEMIALLHDINDDKLNTYGFDVDSFLLDCGMENNDIEQIISSVKCVSFRNRFVQEDLPIEVQIVQDADRLDAIGAIGVARTFAYSGANDIPFYSEFDEVQTTIKHFQEKLLNLHLLLNTKEAKHIALKRIEFINLFYNEFIKETEEFKY